MKRLSTALFLSAIVAALPAFPALAPASRQPQTTIHGLIAGNKPEGPPIANAEANALESAPTIDILIELRDAPLFAGGGTRGRVATSEHSALLEDHLAQLAIDLRRIDRQFSPAATAVGQASASIEKTQLRRTYRRVFAGASARVRRDMLAAIRSLPDVAAVHLDNPVRALLDESVSRIKANEVWATFGTRGRGVVVAIIDTGIDYHHPALGGGFGPGFKVIGGWDFVNNDADPMDDHFHGTHVAGIVAANGDGLVGVAPEASLLSYKALRSDGGGLASDVIAAIERAVDPNEDGDPKDRADVANLSLGGRGNPADPLSRAVDIATASGVVVCIAAGNTGNFRDIQSPGMAGSAITVGAASLTDVRASFSSSGPSKRTQSIKPEVVAPGVGISSTKSGGGTRTLDGTSMAAPHVSGVAALIRSMHRDWSPAEVKSAIVTTAERLPDEVMAAGAGRVDALRAVSADILAVPSTHSFGLDAADRDTWTSTGPIAIHNRSTHPVTLVATLDGMREGVQIAADPASFTLDPGQVQNTILTLTVTNAAVPSPQVGSLSFGGTITFTGGSVPVHIPWAFVKAAEISVHYEDPSILRAIYLNDVFPSDGLLYELALGDDPLSITVPNRTYDIVVDRLPLGTGLRHEVIVLENQSVSGIKDLGLRSEMAPHSVVLTATDEKGGELVAPGRSCSAYNGLYLNRSGAAFEFSSQPQTPNRFSGLSQEATLYATTECESGEGSGRTVHIAQTEPILGLQKSVAAPPASPWVRQDYRLFDHATEPGGSVVWGVPCWRLTWGSTCVFPLYLYGSTPLTGGVETGTLFFTYDHSPHRSAAALIMLRQRGSPWDLLFSPPIWSRDGDVVLDRFQSPSPNSYRPPQGTVLTVGSVPVHAGSGIGMLNGQFLSDIYWRGPIGEERYLDSRLTENTLFDADGKVVRTGQLSGEALSPGKYRVESINTNYRLEGLRGRATLTASFSTAQEEGWPPEWTSLRILDAGGMQTSTVLPGSNASLRFSAVDLSQVLHRTAPIRDESVRVEYRAHGTADWTSLAPVIELRDYISETMDPLHVETGTLFRVDLSPVTNRIDGMIDLRLHAEDPSGNSIELLLEPAFSVGFPRRRSARH